MPKTDLDHVTDSIEYFVRHLEKEMETTFKVCGLYDYNLNLTKEEQITIVLAVPKIEAHISLLRDEIEKLRTINEEQTTPWYKKLFKK